MKIDNILLVFPLLCIGQSSAQLPWGMKPIQEVRAKISETFDNGVNTIQEVFNPPQKNRSPYSFEKRTTTDQPESRIEIKNDQLEYQNESENGQPESQNETNNVTDEIDSETPTKKESSLDQSGKVNNGTCVKQEHLNRDISPAICGSDGKIYEDDESFQYAKCLNKDLTGSKCEG